MPQASRRIPERLSRVKPLKRNNETKQITPISHIRRSAGPDLAEASRPRRVLVPYERRDSGAAALREAVELTAHAGEPTVVTLAPQAAPSRCCGHGPGVYNCAARDEASLERREASDILGPAASRTTIKTLAERRDPSPASRVAEQGFDLVPLPAHRFAPGGNRAARKLRRSGGTQARVVARRARPAKTKSTNGEGAAMLDPRRPKASR